MRGKGGFLKIVAIVVIAFLIFAVLMDNVEEHDGSRENRPSYTAGEAFKAEPDEGSESRNFAYSDYLREFAVPTVGIQVDIRTAELPEHIIPDAALSDVRAYRVDQEGFGRPNSSEFPSLFTINSTQEQSRGAVGDELVALYEDDSDELEDLLLVFDGVEFSLTEVQEHSAQEVLDSNTVLEAQAGTLLLVIYDHDEEGEATGEVLLFVADRTDAQLDPSTNDE